MFHQLVFTPQRSVHVCLVPLNVPWSCFCFFNAALSHVLLFAGLHLTASLSLLCFTVISFPFSLHALCLYSVSWQEYNFQSLFVCVMSLVFTANSVFPRGCFYYVLLFCFYFLFPPLGSSVFCDAFWSTVSPIHSAFVCFLCICPLLLSIHKCYSGQQSGRHSQCIWEVQLKR
jgi:hypothetical protein